MTAEQFFFQTQFTRKWAERKQEERPPPDIFNPSIPPFENCLKKKLKVPPSREDFPAADVYQNRVSLLKKIYKVNLEISQV